KGAAGAEVEIAPGALHQQVVGGRIPGLQVGVAGVDGPASQLGADNQLGTGNLRGADVVGAPHEIGAGGPVDQVVHVVLEVGEGPVPAVVVAPEADLAILGLLRRQVGIAGAVGARRPVQVVEGGGLEALRPARHLAVVIVQVDAHV